MNTWSQVDAMLAEWKNSSMKAPDVCVNLANACIGWNYIFGDRGEQCVPSHVRGRVSSLTPSHPKEAEALKKRCQCCNGKTTCDGCRFHPGGVTLAYDCRGFTYWVLLKAAGITISGAGATSQYNNNANWSEKGLIANMPKDKVCCVFRYDSGSGKMEHTLLYDGAGNYIHCSGEVKKCKTSQYKATHYAIPKGLYDGGDTPVEKASVYAEKGSTVNMRAKASLLSTIVARVPIGATVDVTDRGDEWCAVKYSGKSGYMMTKFLNFGGEPTYTCTITGLTKAQADALAQQYPTCTVKQE